MNSYQEFDASGGMSPAIVHLGFEKQQGSSEFENLAFSS